MTIEVHREGCRCPKCRHKPDCQCKRCEGQKNYPSDAGRSWRPPKRADRCRCGHISGRHDMFGCLICEERGRLCAEFVPWDAPKQPVEIGYEARIKKEGFIQHNRELATCTNCWQTVKIGFSHSLTCVINARAHAISCRQKYGKSCNGHRPNRAG